MKFSIVAIAIFATILGKASPVTRDDATDIVRPETAASLSNEDASSSPLLVVSSRYQHDMDRSTDISDVLYRKAMSSLTILSEQVLRVLWA